MNLLALVGLTSGLFSILLAIAIVIRSSERVHYIWTLFLVSVSLWGWGMFGFSSVQDIEQAVLWWRIAEIGVILIPVLLTHFVLEFLGMAKGHKPILVSFYVVAAFFLLLNIFTDRFFGPLRYSFDQLYYITATPFYSVFIFFFCLSVVYNLSLLSYSYFTGSFREKIQIRYLIYTFAIGFAGGFTSFLPVYGINVYPAWNITIFISSLILSYTIVVHKLMDIRLVMRRYSVYSISVAITVLVTILARYLVIRFKGPQADYFYYGVLFFAILIFPLIQKRAYVLANRYFFSSLYDADKLIAAMSDRLRSTLDRRQIYESVHGFLDSAMHPKSFCILLTALEEIGFTSEYASGITLDKLIRLPNNEYMTESFIKHQKPWVISEFKELHQNKQNAPAIHYLEQLGLEIICPLVVKNRVAGLMAFGQKESGDLYNNEDIEVITIVSTQAAIAIENAQLYDETRSFGVRLVREIDRKRKELTDANERLRKLDVAKSEFISIASHQLRTPLTVIKGYISMMIEGNFGKMSDTISDCLNKVYVSNERLINLVENLLNISRIESGTVRFNFAPARLDDIVQRAVNELLGSAKNKGIKLDFKLMKKAAIEASFDADKLRQVVINIIDNAIKYTSAGTVSIRLDTADDKLVFTVSDKGSGLNPDDIPNLFRKFNRGSGAMLEYTEGTGLGLYVAKQMIDAHHGRIWAESQGKGMGALFGFEIPIVQQ